MQRPWEVPMKMSYSAQESQADNEAHVITPGMKGLQHAVWCWAVVAFVSAASAGSQVLTVDTNGKVTSGQGANVDRRYQQVQPTNIPLPSQELDTKARLEL